MIEYKKLTARECAERLLEIKNPLVLMHARPDGDTVGAGIALCEVFKALGKSPVYISEDNVPKRLEFITRGNEIAGTFEGKEVVAVDIAAPKQAGKILEALPKPTLMIDHHEVGIPFADYYTEKGLSSAGEVVLNVVLELEKMGKITLTQKIAYPIYAAMSSDTACFRYSSANDKTYKIVFEDNETVNELKNQFPLKLKMQDLNKNEKYAYLEMSLPTDEYYPVMIKKGDVMLYGDTCLVIFYKDFETKYDYTKIGHIDNLEELDEKDIKVEFK